MATKTHIPSVSSAPMAKSLHLEPILNKERFMETDNPNRPWQAGDSASDMIRVLEEMIELNEDITARAVARRHPTLTHASTITRNSDRAALLAKYQAKQRELRNSQGLFKNQSYAKMAAELARKDARIAELKRQVEILKASHRAMVRAVGELASVMTLIRGFMLTSILTVGREELQRYRTSAGDESQLLFFPSS